MLNGTALCSSGKVGSEDEKQGTWYVYFRFTNWKGERKQKLETRLFNQARGPGVGEGISPTAIIRHEYYLWGFRGALQPGDKSPAELSTWLTKENIIQKKLLPAFGNKRISEVSAKDVIQWQNEMMSYLE